MSAFVTDGFWRKAVAVVRGLGRAGIPVHVGESTRQAPACYSRYATRTCVYPSPRTAPEAFVAALRRECQDRAIRVLVVPEEETLALVLSNPQAVPDGCTLIGGPAGAFATARDKVLATQAAAAAGLPVLATAAAGNGDAAGVPFPVVVKPRTGSGARGVRYVDAPAALPAALEAVRRDYGDPLVQERMPPGGEPVLTSLLLHTDGTLLAACAHRRLREYPVEGGAATLAETIHAPELVDAAAGLCRDLGCTGFLQVEWRRDPRDQHLKFLEINPRLWGSLALALEAGVNFPAIAYRAACGEPLQPPPPYAAGVRCRFLVPGDLMHLWRNRNRARLHPSWWEFRGQGPWWDEWAPDDRAPAWGRLASLWPLLTQPEWRRYL